jgi:hypothetical protein
MEHDHPAPDKLLDTAASCWAAWAITLRRITL